MATDERDPLVLPQDEFEVVKKVAALSAAGKPHLPGPRRMVGRQATSRYCLSCGQQWPCDGSWQARAEAAEAKLAAIAEHCRDRMRMPGRSGMSLGAATVILGIIGSEEGAGCGG